ncbi:DNA-directed RNA polymerase subunit alpha C-terminal domain-containing protein [Nonomuraea fuscirosea]
MSDYQRIINARPSVATLAQNTGLAADTPIEEAMPGLPTQAFNCLMREGYTTIGALTQLTDLDLLDMRLFGITCLDQVKIALTRHIAPDGSPEAGRWQDRIRHAGTLRHVADRLLSSRDPLDVPATLRNLAARMSEAADMYEATHGSGAENTTQI